MSKPSRVRRPPVRLNRNAPKIPLTPFTEHFQGFDRVGAVRSVFGDRTEEVLAGLRVGFIPNRGMYMGIRDADGNLAVGTYHLKNSPFRTLYLDVVHELFHIDQRMKDRKYFHREFMKFIEDRTLYYSSPIEVPAYRHTVREAERIGMSPEQIVEYLKMLEAPPKVWRGFIKAMNLKKKGSKPAKRVTKFPVKIRREVHPVLHPFSDYFKGFGEAGPVRELFGGETEDVLKSLKVEFIDSPFPTITLSDEDGHLVVSRDYFRKGTVSSIYLDTLLCLNLLKGSAGRDIPATFEGALGNDPRVLGAYRAMVKEGRRLGIGEGKLMEHLQLPRFIMSESEYAKFLGALDLKNAG